MKRYVKSAQKAKVPEKQNVYDVLEAMDWNKPTFCDRVKDGYRLKWGGFSVVDHEALRLGQERAMEEFPNLPKGSHGVDWTRVGQEFFDRKRELVKEARPEAEQIVKDDIAEIYEKTGIQCRLTREGNIVVPFGTGGKS